MQRVFTAFLPSQKAKFILDKRNTKSLVFLKKLIKADKIRAVIDCTYPLQELAAAHGYSVSVQWGLRWRSPS
ncbi:zinc-binding dehydrogenase [Nostoc sp.]|uniref:zinc-binding dehydrogenase n=1 Tax=Nostoc sp. TaxID=1180 RepID=UPI002FF494B4